MKTKFLMCILSFSSLLISCEDVVNVSPKNELESQVVVEGFIVTEQGGSYVKLSETAPYFSGSSANLISGAEVTVTSGSGERIAFLESSKGYYSCPSEFQGVEGETYHLLVNVGGKMITAESSIQKAVEVESIRVVYIEKGDPQLREGYYLFGLFSDQKNVKNYYRAEVFVNGIRQVKFANHIIVFDDRLFENQAHVEGQFGYWANNDDDDFKISQNDEVQLLLYSIDYPAYTFLKALSETPGQGGLFGKNPANVPSNIKGALGIFQACSVRSSEKITVQ